MTTQKLNDQQRKAIFADPVESYRQYINDVTEPPAELIELHNQHEQLREQLKASQLESKKLSRKIGQARKNNQPADDLLAEIKHHSAEAKQQKAQLAELKQKILAYFEPATEPSKTQPTLIEPRKHPETAIDVSQITIRQHNNEDEAWNRYTDTNPATTIYHRIEWKHLIHEVFGHSACFFMATDNKNTVRGILPLIRLNSRLFGDFLVSMPYYNYGGAVADTPEIEQKLIETANHKAAELGVSHIEYRDDIQREGMPARTDKVNMILPLPDDDTLLWQGFGSKLRAQIKRAQREPHQVIIGGHNCLQDFYSVFARNMRDLGTPVYSRNFFDSILKTFPQHSRIVIIRLGKKPVAAAFLLGQGERMEIPWASTIRDVKHLSINMLLYWEVLKLAISQGYRYFDFGRSSKHAGTYRFKQQWGAQPKPCYWHYWLADGVEMPKLTPDNPKYAMAIRLWQKLPVWASKILGPPIVRNLP